MVKQGWTAWLDCRWHLKVPLVRETIGYVDAGFSNATRKSIQACDNSASAPSKLSLEICEIPVLPTVPTVYNRLVSRAA